MRRLATWTMTICCAAGAISCATEKEIVMVEEAPVPEEADGFLEIATEQPIRVTVIGRPEIVAERPLPGRAVIHKSELARLLRALQEFKERGSTNTQNLSAGR